MRTILSAYVQHVTEAPGRDHADAGTVFFQQDIGSDRRAVNQKVQSVSGSAGTFQDLLESSQPGATWVVRRRR
jgi:hypothetical protein